MRGVTIVWASLPLALLASCCAADRSAPSTTEEGRERAATSNPGQEVAMPVNAAFEHVKGAFPAQVAGAFYDDDGSRLAVEVRRYVDAALPAAEIAGRDVVGLLAPHAGYTYSGPVAGAAYRAVAGGDYRLVVVLALSHRRGASRLALLDRPAYDTPLGSLPIDLSAARKLVERHERLFAFDERMFQGEHSLEVQLPFIRTALPKARILPVIVAAHDEAVVRAAGEALYRELGEQRDVLFVVSSDLSHFFSDPEARGFDDKTLSTLAEWRLDEWKKEAASEHGMCGFWPMQVLVALFSGFAADTRRVTRLAYQNSGETSGDRSRVVGYGALAFTVDAGVRTAGGTDFGPYGPAERRWLMDLARRSVAAAARDEGFTAPEPPSPVLAAQGAAFVTLKKHGELRGCIGHVIARIPLFRCVADVARAAAVQDTRFSPVEPGELPELTYEISVLTPPAPIRPDDVVVGRDGLIVSRGYASGLLLPQVPVEWGWNRLEFLDHTCRKAGLPAGCWKEAGTELKAFQAIVFGEDDLD